MESRCATVRVACLDLPTPGKVMQGPAIALSSTWRNPLSGKRMGSLCKFRAEHTRKGIDRWHEKLKPNETPPKLEEIFKDQLTLPPSGLVGLDNVYLPILIQLQPTFSASNVDRERDGEKAKTVNKK